MTRMFSQSSFLLILAIVLVLCQESSGLKSWSNFKRKHIGCPASLNCNNEMQRPQYGCKSTNTFICANEDTVKNLCKGKTSGNVLGGSFQLVSCIKRKEPCSYYQERDYEKICLECRNGVPVHFVRLRRC